MFVCDWLGVWTIFEADRFQLGEVLAVVQLVVVLVDPVDCGSTVLHVSVLFPCSEVEGLFQGAEEGLEVLVVHVATS